MQESVCFADDSDSDKDSGGENSNADEGYEGVPIIMHV